MDNTKSFTNALGMLGTPRSASRVQHRTMLKITTIVPISFKELVIITRADIKTMMLVTMETFHSTLNDRRRDGKEHILTLDLLVEDLI